RSNQHGIQPLSVFLLAASARVVPARDAVAHSDRRQHHLASLGGQTGWRRPPSDAGCHWKGSFADTNSKWQSPFAPKDRATTRGTSSAVQASAVGALLS